MMMMVIIITDTCLLQMFRHLDILLIDVDPAIIMRALLSTTNDKYEAALAKTIEKVSIDDDDEYDVNYDDNVDLPVFPMPDIKIMIMKMIYCCLLYTSPSPRDS